MKKLFLILLLACITIPFIVSSKAIKEKYYSLTRMIHDIAKTDVTYVDISGNKIVKDAEIISRIYVLENDESVIKSPDEIIHSLARIPIIKKVALKYDTKGGMLVNILERNPILFYNDGAKVKIIDDTFEEFSYDDLDLSGLIFIRGQFEVENIKDFYTRLKKFQTIFRSITEIENFYNYRFNIVLNNRILVLLPEKNIDASLLKLTQLIVNNDLMNSDIKVVDMRRSKWIALQVYRHGERKQYIPQNKRILHKV